MKKFKLIPILLFVLIYSCNNIKKENQTTSPDIQQEVEQEIETKENIEPEIINETKINKTMEVNSKSKPDALYFNALLGKYPTQIGLFQNEILASRLKNINRFDYEALVANWNTESPITMEDQIVHASGCKSHNCPSSGYELFIDLKNDNINIYHFRSNTMRVYTEKDWITLPSGFAKEIETKKANAKIGSTSDDMTSTYDINLK